MSENDALSSHGTERTEPTFDEPIEGEKRATKKVEELGGLPDDNQFAELVREMRDDGLSWGDIFDQIEEVQRIVDKAAFEEDLELIPDWRVAVVKNDPNSTSGKRYEYHERSAETPEEAELMVERHTGWPVESEKTEQVGYGKVS